VTGGWRKLHNEELYNLYSLPTIIRMSKSRRMRWAGNVARMERRGMHILVGNPGGKRQVGRPRDRMERYGLYIRVCDRIGTSGVLL
jgi:hypothetical protein